MLGAGDERPVHDRVGQVLDVGDQPPGTEQPRPGDHAGDASAAGDGAQLLVGQVALGLVETTETGVRGEQRPGGGRGDVGE